MTTGAVSEEDLRDITNSLGPDELKHLFLNLGISQRDIEHAEMSAGTTDTRLKAFAVLIWWRKKEGKKATHEKVLEAKRNLDHCRGIYFIFCI